MSKELTFIGILILMFSGCFIAGRCSSSDPDTISSYESLARIESQKAKVFQDDAKLWRYRAEVAEVKSIDAIKRDQQFASLSNDFDLLKKSLKNLEAASFTGTKSSYTITHIKTSKDTIIVLNLKDTLQGKFFSYRDSSGWFSASGIILDNGQVPSLQFDSRDSLITVVTQRRRTFWQFILRKPILCDQEIKSCNPHTQVSYSKSVIVKRK